MVSSPNNLKRSIEEKKKELEQKKKNLINKERESSKKRMLEIGKFALRAQIDNLSDDILFGAFIEISKSMTNTDFVSKCLENSRRSSTEKNGNRITISFKQPPPIEIKNHLKNLDFKWNKFRGEYYGFGDKSSLSRIVENIDCKIEVIE